MRSRVHGGNRSVFWYWTVWVVGRRSWDCVIWRHPCSNIYIKHHIIEKWLIETSNRRLVWWVSPVSDCAIRETSDQRGKLLKTFFTFDFHILLLQRHTDARIIPCRCISIKKDFQWGPCWEPTLPATETVSANWIVVERFKMSQRSHRYIFLQTRTHIMTINQHNSVRHAFSVPNCAASSTCWQFFHYRPPGELWYTTGPIAKILCKNSIYIATHTHIYNIYIERFSISIGNTENHVATLTCLEWHTVKIC